MARLAEAQRAAAQPLADGAGLAAKEQVDEQTGQSRTAICSRRRDASPDAVLREHVAPAERLQPARRG